MCNSILSLAEAQDMAAKLAKNTHEPAHVVRDGMLLRIASDADIACWQLRDVVWSVEPDQVYDLDDALTTSIITTMVHEGMSADDPPPGFPDDDDGTEDGGGPPRKVSLAERQAAHEAELAANPPLPTIVLDYKTGTITHIPRCKNCEGDHHTWQCPEIHALLRAEPVVMVVDVEHAPTCRAAGCIQNATHDDAYCCYHYSEECGFNCDCVDDDYLDAAWESAQGSYNGF
jgi:hypothetical protein